MYFRQRRYYRLTVSLLIGALTFLAAPAYGQNKADAPSEQPALTIGKSQTVGKSLTAAREAAVFDALHTAVVLKALAIVPTEIMAKRFDAIVGLIDQQTEMFVRTYKVLAENPTENGYHVLIQAIVSESRLETAIQKAGLMEQAGTLPTILFLITEQNVGETTPRFWWHSDRSFEGGVTSEVLAAELTSLGYMIADPKTKVIDKNYPMDISAEMATQIGRQYRADIVITGKAVAITAKDTRVTDLKTYQGSLTVRAYRTDTGAQIGISHAATVTVKTDDKTGGKSVLSLLVKDVVEDLTPQLAFHQQHPDSANPTPITIEVVGTDHLRSFVALRKTLSAMQNVTQMQVKALTPPTALLVAHYKGSLKEIADELKKAAEGTIKIKINMIPVDRLKVTLSP